MRPNQILPMVIYVNESDRVDTDHLVVKTSTNSTRAFSFLQQLNIRTFFTLLQTLLPELEFGVSGSAEINPQSPIKRLAPVICRILPHLRQYSTWLSFNISYLLAQKDDALIIQIQEFWRSYAETLTLLAASFVVPSLPQATYMLPEDVDTLGFLPFDGPSDNSRYLLPDGKFKPRFSNEGTTRLSSSEETLARIRDFVVDGLVPDCEISVVAF